MITQKKELLKALETNPANLKGNLVLTPLNALDEKQFLETVNQFPPGNVVIVNEGLLMYLDSSEKEILCSNIRNVLQERGGYWVTADIYLKVATRNIDLALDAQTAAFFEQHQVEQNRFESLEAA